MKQLVGFEIKVRGPFDISERIIQLPSSGLNFPSPNRYHESMFFNRGSSPTHILLNPLSDDKCWDILFMIAGGTGLTPMLQLVSLIKLFLYLIRCYNILIIIFRWNII